MHLRTIPKVQRVGMITGTFISIVLSAFTLTAYAEQDDEIKTDRPDFVESSDVVGKGRVQLETSYSIERHNADGVRNRTSTTPTLMRIGIDESTEIRLESDGRAIFRTTDDGFGRASTTRGFSDLSVGVKWHMQDQKESVPGVAWLLHVDIDSGSAAFRGQGVRPSVRMVAEWELPNEFSVGIMPGFTYDKTSRGKRFVNGLLGVVVGRTWTEQLRTFIEVAAPQLASSKHGGSTVTYNLGAAYLLNKDWQADLVYQHGANRNAPDRTWGVGLSARF